MFIRTNLQRARRCGIDGLVALIVFVTGISIAVAQLPTATILGVVKDSTGAVVPGAKLTVRNSDRGQTRSMVSAGDGSYRFSALPVGTYEVRAEESAFRAEVQSGLTLAVSQEAVVNFTLIIGAIEQTVEVSAEAPLVNTTSGSLGGLVGEQQVSDLPLNGRNYVDLTLLQPGVVQHRMSTQSALGVGTWFSTNGASPRSNYYMLDGAPTVNAYGATSASAAATTLGIEGIREWRVVTNSFSAEYGMRMGSQMSVVTKSGSNEIHGSLFEYLRNSALDARNFFDYQTPGTTLRLPPYRRNQYGGSVGGPIKKDKLFYFVTYEGLAQRLGETNVANVIPAASKVDGALGFSILPAIKPILALYPDPNLPGNRFTFPATQVSDERFGQARGDYNFSSSDMVFLRYTVDDSSGIDPLTYPQFKRLRDSRNQFLTGSDTHTFSPALLGSFRFSFSRTFLNVTSPSGISGMQYSFVPGLEIGNLSIAGLTTLGPDVSVPNALDQNVYTWSGDLFYTRGRHSLKFGSLINYFQSGLTGGQNYTGTISFSDIPSFLQGKPNTYSAVTPGSIRGRIYDFKTLGFYLQDDLRATSRVTLNLGLRYEFHTDFNEANGHGSSLHDVQRDAAFAVGLPFQNPSHKAFSPRFGFAWDVKGDGKTAVRGGFGLLYDIANFGGPLLLTSVGAPPFSTQSSVTSTAANLLNFSLPFFFPSSAIGKSPRTMDYNIQQPHLFTYNFTLERQLPESISVSLAYAGSRGMNLGRNMDGNPTVPGGVPQGGACVPLPAGQIADFVRPSCWLGTETRINPAWTNIQFHTADGNSWYNSLQFVVTKRMSKGLQLQSTYTWSKLVDEKSGFSSADNGGSGTITDPVHRSVDQALADWSVAHIWRFNAIYRLPQVSGFRSVAKKLLNGWWMSGILTAQTGLPFTPTLGSNRSRSQASGGGANIDRPSLYPGRNNDNITSGTSTGCMVPNAQGVPQGVAAGTKLGTPDHYFDPCAFAIPVAGFLGGAGRNILTGPGVANLDFSLVKDTSLRFLGEGGKLEFRAEFFNILNRANFSRPAASIYAARANTEAPLSSAGSINSTDTTSRQIQFALKLLW